MLSDALMRLRGGPSVRKMQSALRHRLMRGPAAMTSQVNSVLKKVAISVCALSLFACAAPRVDTSTDESVKKSIERVRGSLPEEKRADFDNAIRDLALADFKLQDIMAQQGGNLSVDDLAVKMKRRLQGKTGDQILSEAAKLREDRERKVREQAVGEIAELRKKAAAALLARQKLSAFTVSRSRLYRKTIGFLTEPVIELSVKNGTQVPISRVYFHGVVASPGRSVPWISADFNHSIPGGLEPGESGTWQLAPNMFSGWGTKTPSDAILTVNVTKLDGPDGKTLYDAEGLSEAEQQRLADLQRKFPSR